MNHCLFIFFVFLYCIQISIQLNEADYNIEINVNRFTPEGGNIVGKKGVISLFADCSTNIFNDEKDIEENTKFQTTITDGNNNRSFPINCRFWDSIEGLCIFCDLDDTTVIFVVACHLNFSQKMKENNYS